MDLHLRWHSFLIPGIFFMALGTIGISVWGLTPLAIGGAVAGFFLLLAAVLKAMEGRDSRS